MECFHAISEPFLSPNLKCFFSLSFPPPVCHAELNAIMNKNSADVKGCTIYVALFPCNECAKLIIQAGRGGVPFVTFAPRPAHRSSPQRWSIQNRYCLDLN